INKIYDKWFLQPVPPKGVNLHVPMSASFKKVVAKPTDSGDPTNYQHATNRRCASRRGLKSRAANAFEGTLARMSYKWNWGVFFQLSPDGTYTYVQLLLFGAGWTLATALLAWAIALSVGTVVGVIRTSPVPWLVRLGNAYVELFRNIPLLVQRFLLSFVLREVMPQAIGDWLKQSANASFYNAVICLGLYTSA